jgi:hypothetical protein
VEDRWNDGLMPKKEIKLLLLGAGESGKVGLVALHSPDYGHSC